MDFSWNISDGGLTRGRSRNVYSRKIGLLVQLQDCRIALQVKSHMERVYSLLASSRLRPTRLLLPPWNVRGIIDDRQDDLDLKSQFKGGRRSDVVNPTDCKDQAKPDLLTLPRRRCFGRTSSQRTWFSALASSGSPPRVLIYLRASTSIPIRRVPLKPPFQPCEIAGRDRPGGLVGHARGDVARRPGHDRG